jgi:hypothetical protein
VDRQAGGGARADHRFTRARIKALDEAVKVAEEAYERARKAARMAAMIDRPRCAPCCSGLAAVLAAPAGAKIALDRRGRVTDARCRGTSAAP